MIFKGLWHASVHVRHLDFCSGKQFFKFTVREENLSVSASKPCWNLVKRILDHLWAILVVYVCIFFKINWEIGCRCEKVLWGGVQSGSGQKLLSPRSQFVSKGRQKKAKKQWDEDHRRISVARDVHNSWRTMKCMRVYSSDTAFAQHLLSLEMRLRVG